MNEADNLLEKILNLPNGACFYKCDLHTHTPMDNRFKCGNQPLETEEQKQAFARKLMRYVREDCRLDILGVTEHNDVSWLSYIQKAAEEENVILFPGVELGALAGQKTVHFLALFDPGTNWERIHHWISSLDLTPDNRFHSDNTPRVVQKDTRELTKLISRSSDGLPGIPIAAHASSSNGLFKSMQGEGRSIAYTDRNLLAVEIPSTRNELPDFERRLVNGELDDAYQRKRVACLNHSDGRSLENREGLPAIGSKATYIKLSSPTIEGLRQAFLDFESRIRLEGERDEDSYPCIVGVAIEGRFLQGADGNPFLLHFNPNLNCIIGGRGSGKSALLEAIRYVFDVPPKTGANQEQADDLLRKTLDTGARVNAFYRTGDGTLYRVERTWGEEPHVFDAETGEEKQGLHPRQLVPDNPIEVYGQKEIYEISKNSEFQLRLLDNYVAEDLHPIEEQEQDIIRQLKGNAQTVLGLEQEIETATEKLRELPGVREQLARLEQQEAVTHLETKKQLEREKSLLEQVEGAVNDLITAVESLPTTQSLAPDLLSEQAISNLPHEEMLIEQRKLLDEIETAFQNTLKKLSVHLKDIWAKSQPQRNEWQEVYERENDAYRALLREFPDASAERYMRLERQRSALEQVEQEVRTRQPELNNLREKRQKLLEELRRLRRQEAFQLRQNKAQELDRLLGDIISIDVILEGNRDAYRDYLKTAVSGHRIASSVIDGIVKSGGEDGYYDPIHLVAAIRQEQQHPSENSNTLPQAYDVSEAYCRRLATLPDDVLYELELYRVPDLPVIKLRVGDRDKPLHELSVGQKCTAILSLILVERETPLIIDQPEDDLDNRFIFDEIVTTLRREKERRQFVIATHNANIPVSGDAELIVVLDADDEHGWIEKRGSIDDSDVRVPVENILEGGRDAFRIRQQKYGISQ